MSRDLAREGMPGARAGQNGGVPEGEGAPPNPEAMRLQKYLARAGLGGRRYCEHLIGEGRVTVNGRVVTEMGTRVDPATDEVAFDGAPVSLPSGPVTLALNKPAGCYTTMHEQTGRFCVADLLPLQQYPSLYHVGRLDRDTTGILLFSTDGELGNRLLHPSRHVEKEYLAQVEGVPAQASLDRLRRGILIREGEQLHRCAPATADVLRKLPNRYRSQDSCLVPGLPGTSFVRVCIHEGVKHQVKLMLGAIGHPVLRLHRTRFGSVELGSLPAGRWRELSPEELSRL